MRDQFGREISYLRLSVTDLCNLRCKYCMPAEGVIKKSHSDILTVEEISAVVRAAASLGITKVRLTGGEPLVRHGILDIVSSVSEVPGISEVCMTTNGILLPKFADEIKKRGVSRLNISLDTINPEKYRDTTRGGSVEDALSGINSALGAGFERVKINAVLTSDTTDDEIRELAEYVLSRGMNIRFIELMPIGQSALWAEERFVSNSQVLKVMPELVKSGVDGVAETYSHPGFSGSVGLISPISSHFCPECNRIRITSDGKLKPCLHSAQEINIKGLSGNDLLETMKSAIFEKPRRHAIDSKHFSDAARNMNAIGG